MPDRKDNRDRKDEGDRTGFIPKHGGYQNLLSYQKAQIVFDATVYFCKRFVNVRFERRRAARSDDAGTFGGA